VPQEEVEECSPSVSATSSLLNREMASDSEEGKRLAAKRAALAVGERPDVVLGAGGRS